MITLYNGVNFEDNANFEALEKELKEKLERSEDFGGDLYLELAECLIAEEKYDEACENLLIAIKGDTEIRECAYPLIVDLISKGKCIDLVPDTTFEWLCFGCYIEAEKKKDMYIGKAFCTENLDEIGNVLERYITDFGGDENVGKIYDRLSDLTYQQMPTVSTYDYSLDEFVHEALCTALENELPLEKLSNNRLMQLYAFSNSEALSVKILKYLLDIGVEVSDWLYDGIFGAECGLGIVASLVESYIEEKNYAILTWIFDNVDDGCWDYEAVRERITDPIINCIVETNDIKTVSDFVAGNRYLGKASGDSKWPLFYFIDANYLDESGCVRKEWVDLTSVYEELIDLLTYCCGSEDLDSMYGDLSKKFVQNAFTAFEDIFTDDDSISRQYKYDIHPLGLVYIYSSGERVITHKIESLEDFKFYTKTMYKLIKERYFDEQ
jgi:hypothetical protein